MWNRSQWNYPLLIFCPPPPPRRLLGLSPVAMSPLPPAGSRGRRPGFSIMRPEGNHHFRRKALYFQHFWKAGPPSRAKCKKTTVITMISLSRRLFAHVSAKTQNDLSYLHTIKDKSQYFVRGVAKIDCQKTTVIIRVYFLQRL